MSLTPEHHCCWAYACEKGCTHDPCKYMADDAGLPLEHEHCGRPATCKFKNMWMCPIHFDIAEKNW